MSLWPVPDEETRPGHTEPHVVSSAEDQLARVPDQSRLSKQCLDVSDTVALSAALAGQFADLVSFGGSAMLVLMGAFGLVQSAHIHRPRSR